MTITNQMKITKAGNNRPIIATGVQIVLLLAHIGLLVLFTLLKVYFMSGVNIVSIMIYSIGIKLSRKKELISILLAACEIIMHMICATVCLGWGFGFEMYFFGLVPLVFYGDYLNRESGNGISSLIPISVGIAAVFVLLKAYTYIQEPFYTVNHEVVISKIAYIINAIANFAFIIVYNANYEKLTLSREEHLKTKASTDMLTGLNNRRSIQNIINVEFENGRALFSEMAISIFDIDDFKKVNDTFGHSAGDYVLTRMAEEIRKMSEENFYIGRWGGEEFVAFAVGHDTYPKMIVKVKKLLKDVSEIPFVYEGKEFKITMTAGVAKYRAENSVEAMFSRADKYLYEGKANGKNQCVAND